MLSGEGNETRAPNDSFLKYIENTFLVIMYFYLGISVFGHSRGTLFLKMLDAI